MEISRTTFIQLPVANKMDVLYDLMVENKEDHDAIKKDVSKCNFEISKRKKIDTTVAGFMGFVGGMVGFFANKIFR